MKNADSIRSHAPFVGRLVSQTPAFLRTQLWVWPLLAAAILVFIGVWLRSRIERAMETHISANLQTTLNANTEALREWAAATRSLAELVANDDRVRELTGKLLSFAQAKGNLGNVLAGAPELPILSAHLQPVLNARGFEGYALLDTNLVVLAAGSQQVLGLKCPPAYAAALEPCFSGKAVVTPPFLTGATRPDDAGRPRPEPAVMFAAAPVRSGDGTLAAILGLRVSPEKDFTRILGTASWGRTGETYAFDRNGVLLSESRFDDELKRLGLIPDMPGSQSILALELRDPLVNLTRGQQSHVRRSEQPLTRAVQEALAGRSGGNASGYRDYRGVEVVGAWAWLPDFQMGLVTELDRREAFEPVLPVRAAFWFMFGLLAAASAIVFLLMRMARQAVANADQLGQYALEEEIGSGAFGRVFRGHHALMRRSVAVKVLDPLAGGSSEARFEREVQLTSQLTHPNTIALYDYGRSPGGLFYYAMEYLEGLSLSVLVKEYGPQPEGRVIHILRQVCAALAEAHARGLVHRDIKPHNILLTHRGGIPDFVKVLDFGLVKPRERAEDVELTAANATLGTPLYISPEAIKGQTAVTELSDIYSLGAVGYELLTGETPFSGSTVAEVLVQQLRSNPEAPSARLKRPVSPDLEQLLLRCLAKTPSARPSAVGLEDALSRCCANGTWSRSVAEEWWANHHKRGNGKQAADSSGPPPKPANWDVVCGLAR